jgi:hypothetical protein
LSKSVFASQGNFRVSAGGSSAAAGSAQKFNADAVENAHAQINADAAKMRHSIMPINSQLFEFATRQTRIKPAQPRVANHGVSNTYTLTPSK